MRKHSPLISIIIPVHNESDNLAWHHEKISNFCKLQRIKYEVIYIDDGSTDNSLQEIRRITQEFPDTRYISFSKNFGKEAATTAGLAKAKGDAAAMIDADGQHPVEMLVEFIQKWQDGAQVVIGVRQNDTGGGWLKEFSSHLFYATLKLFGSSTSTVQGATDFRLLDRKVIDAFNTLTEHGRVTRNLIDWLGFRRDIVPFVAHERHSGTASYSMRKLVHLGINGFVKHSTRPLKLIGLLGFFVSTVSFALGVFIAIEQYVLGDPMRIGVTGSALLAIFLSFMIGIVLFCQGLLALYIENIYYEAQGRPLFIIAEEG